MTLPMQTINGKDLARFASDKLHIWSDLIGCEVTHTERGSGVILSVEQRPNYIPLIRIKFSKETATFNSDSFLNGKSSVFTVLLGQAGNQRSLVIQKMILIIGQILLHGRSLLLVENRGTHCIMLMDTDYLQVV